MMINEKTQIILKETACMIMSIFLFVAAIAFGALYEAGVLTGYMW